METIFVILFLLLSMSLCAFVFYNTTHLKKDIAAKVSQMDAIREKIENEAINANNKLVLNAVSFADSSNLYLTGPGSEIIIDKETLNYSFLEEMGIKYQDIELVEGQVMCLMPFNRRYEKVYNIIKERCKANNYNCVRSDDAVLDKGSMLKTILEMIIKSQLVIAVLNGRNANVFYEVGIAHALGKKVILIAEHKIVLPKKNSTDDARSGDGVFDLQNRRIILYNNPNELSKKLDETLKHIHKI